MKELSEVDFICQSYLKNKSSNTLVDLSVYGELVIGDSSGHITDDVIISFKKVLELNAE